MHVVIFQPIEPPEETALMKSEQKDFDLVTCSNYETFTVIVNSRQARKPGRKNDRSFLASQQ